MASACLTVSLKESGATVVAIAVIEPTAPISTAAHARRQRRPGPEMGLCPKGCFMTLLLSSWSSAGAGGRFIENGSDRAFSELDLLSSLPVTKQHKPFNSPEETATLSRL
jgi:hypothetical protein